MYLNKMLYAAIKHHYHYITITLQHYITVFYKLYQGNVGIIHIYYRYYKLTLRIIQTHTLKYNITVSI